MLFGMVRGTVVSTCKDEELIGLKFLLVETLDVKGKPTSQYVVAADSVEAGVGELVLYASGSSARQTETTRNKPVDATIMAIVDTWEVEGKTVYEKYANDVVVVQEKRL